MQGGPIACGPVGPNLLLLVTKNFHIDLPFKGMVMHAACVTVSQDITSSTPIYIYAFVTTPLLFLSIVF